MTLPRAIDLFHECLQHPEPLIDASYYSGHVIVSREPSHDPTPAVTTWKQVLERIIAAKVAIADEKPDEYDRHVREMDSLLLRSPYAQFLELTAFFPVFDIGFSMYRKLPDAQRVKFLSDILVEYIKRRHGIYTSHGYSATTVQVRKDFEKHKIQAGFATVKAKKIFRAAGYMQGARGMRSAILEAKKRYYFIDDRQGRMALQELRKSGAIRYDKWSQSHQGKHADVVFVGGSANYFICEMKHVKEAGGGQNKQIQELIEFIGIRSESNMDKQIRHVAFLDGVYFNELISPKNGTKAFRQKSDIEKYLATGNQSFFVNTYGFKKLLRRV